MKPTKNRIYCYGCKKPKMLFPSKDKADNFMTFNSDVILEETGKAPVRSYFCEVCGGYHVTSNPSVEEGERMDCAIKNRIRQFREASINAEDVKCLRHQISRRIEKAKILINFGFVEDAEDLLDICKLDYDDVRLLDPLGTKSNRVKCKIDKLQAKITNIKEYTILNECQIELLLEDKVIKSQKAVWHNLQNILSLKRLHRLLNSIDECFEVDDYIAAKQLLVQCRDIIEGFSGIGKAQFQETFSNKISEREYKYQREAKKRTKTNSKTEVSTSDNQSRPVDSYYKKSMISIIERIELAAKAYEQNDMSLCESQIEIADFMLDELNVDDSNVDIVKYQVSKWRQLIKDKNDQ